MGFDLFDPNSYGDLFGGQAPATASANLGGAPGVATSIYGTDVAQGQGNQSFDTGAVTALLGGDQQKGAAAQQGLTTLGGQEYQEGVGLGQAGASDFGGLQKSFAGLAAPQVQLGGALNPAQGAYDAYQQAASGQGPSGAGYLLTQGTDAALAAQGAGAAGARGNAGLANASYGAAQNAANIEQQSANQAAQLKAQELAAARQGLASTGLGLSSLSTGVATHDADLKAATQALSTQSQLAAATGATNAGIQGFQAGAGAGNDLLHLGYGTGEAYDALGASTYLGGLSLGQGQGLAYGQLGQGALTSQLGADVSNQGVQAGNNTGNATRGQAAGLALLSGLASGGSSLLSSSGGGAAGGAGAGAGAGDSLLPLAAAA